MRIIFMKHGQSRADEEGRYGGDYDDDLSALGNRQAQFLAEHKKDKKIEIIYTSPLRRAKESAFILQEVIGCKVEELHDLKERDFFGILSGMKREEARKEYPEEARLAEDYRNTLPNAESYNDFKARVLKVFDEITKTSHKIVGVMTHAGVIRCLLREFFGKELDSVPDCSVYRIEIVDGKPVLK